MTLLASWFDVYHAQFFSIGVAATSPDHPANKFIELSLAERHKDQYVRVVPGDYRAHTRVKFDDLKVC